MSSFLKKHNTTLIGSQIIAELEGGLAPVKSLLARGVATPMSLVTGGRKHVSAMNSMRTLYKGAY